MMTANAPVRPSGAGPLVLIGVLALAVGALLTRPAAPSAEAIITGQHAVERHADEALAVRAAWQNGTCRSREAYYSGHVAQFLYLCFFGNDQYGGWIVAADGHEITAFIAGWPYWSGVIARDRYARIPTP